MGYRVNAVDLSSRMVFEARSAALAKGLSIDFQQQDAEALSFDDHRFDVVVSRNLLWTLPDPQRALSDWRRVLKPGGRLLVSDGFWRNRSWRELPELLGELPRSRPTSAPGSPYVFSWPTAEFVAACPTTRG
jgi:ubiquinone/menaquinone biosynthesis C-methylase UbiE